MDSYKLKDGSWHLWLANFNQGHWNKLEKGDRTDICSYTRRVIRGAALCLLMGTLVAVLSGWVIFSIGNMFGWLLLGYKLEFFSQMFWFMVTLLVGMAAILYSKEKIFEKLDEIGEKIADRPKRQPGFIKLAYRKFKDKTCFRLEIE